MTALPKISVAFDADTGLYDLMATSYGMTMPAGPRLFRSAPTPDIEFHHYTEESANRDASALQDYIDTVWGKKSKKEKEEPDLHAMTAWMRDEPEEFEL